MKDKLRIELASENRLGRDTFYAELDLPATAEQIKDAKQRARFTDDGNVTYQAVSILYFPPLPDLEHIRFDSATVEELNFLAQRLDSLPDEQFTISLPSRKAPCICWTSEGSENSRDRMTAACL